MDDNIFLIVCVAMCIYSFLIDSIVYLKKIAMDDFIVSSHLKEFARERIGAIF